MYSIYQIQVGDTLDTIANKVGTTKQILLTINGITDSNLIPGNFIVIPMNVNLPFTTYVVKKGDNIYEIARNYGVEYETLLEINGLGKDDYIYPEQEIIIPKGNTKLYKVQEGDSINSIEEKTGVNINKIKTPNGEIYLEKDQIIMY